MDSHDRYRARSTFFLTLLAMGLGCTTLPDEFNDTGSAAESTGELTTTTTATTSPTASASGQQDGTGVQDGSGGEESSTSDTGGSDTVDPDTVGSDTDGSDTDPPPAMCGDGNPDRGEECDDANDDPSDGCLRDCTEPRSCAEILDVVRDADDDTYIIFPDEAPLTTWCDMTTDGGGWTLVGKVNPTDMDTPAHEEPLAWLSMELAPVDLETADLQMNGPLASHGSERFTPLVAEGSLARLELVAADDFDIRVAWFKEVGLPTGMEQWFDYGGDATEVCSNLGMTDDCSMNVISPTGGDNSPTLLGGMDLNHFGYDGGYPIHMRLSDDTNGPTFSGLCSSTENTSWPDSYGSQWGNALLIWLRE